MTDPKPDNSELAKRLRSVTEYVRDCERRVNQGEIMDLEGLDRNVVEICTGIAGLPQEEGQALEKPMSMLIEDLERLADTMRVQQDKVASDGKKS
ncbi:MAG: hypothetical protein PW788_07215 [Micavibrio sp.]|nr:hypothetical protein [Micavibrio sp.]